MTISYLRLIVGGGIIKMDPKKIEAVKEWTIPRTKKELQAFIGFLNYYLSRTLFLFLFFPYDVSPSCFTVAPYVFLYYHKSCISIFDSCSALVCSFYLSFRSLAKGCAWFPSRVQQFLCQMTRSWHHASALHFALHCSALVGDCLGF